MSEFEFPPLPDQSDDKEVAEWFVETGKNIGVMLGEKRKAYGDNLSNAGKFLKILYPDGIPSDAYSEVLVMVRVLDKMVRLANKHRDNTGWEDQENPWIDVAGYAIAILYDKDRGAL